jgi:ABC-type polysaccharide/polyol phosphate transport system ATPase subunit
MDTQVTTNKKTLNIIEKIPGRRKNQEALHPVISLQNVSVSFYIPREKVVNLKEYVIRWIKGQNEKIEFQALRKVSFEVHPGETVGIIGRNGSGKSTLLRVIARVLQPMEGRVKTTGQIAPMLELGAGFHQELTGRENIFLNGTLLGHSQAEISERVTEIIDFAELWDFIDAPLRTYSSGMVTRLGFAAATAFVPDILLLDEILSVGDEKFQQKCLDRIRTFKEAGTTFVIVSHSSELIRNTCDRAIWLDRGKVRLIGDAAQVIEKYHISADI